MREITLADIAASFTRWMQDAGGVRFSSLRENINTFLRGHPNRLFTAEDIEGYIRQKALRNRLITLAKKKKRKIEEQRSPTFL